VPPGVGPASPITRQIPERLSQSAFAAVFKSVASFRAIGWHYRIG
jgi:hypothetical protein